MICAHTTDWTEFYWRQGDLNILQEIKYRDPLSELQVFVMSTLSTNISILPAQSPPLHHGQHSARKSDWPDKTIEM